MRSNETEDSLPEQDLDEITNMLTSINSNGGGHNLLGKESNSHLSAHAASAVAMAGMEMSKDNEDQDEYERWLRIKLNIDANISLSEDNQRLKLRLETVENNFKLKELDMTSKIENLEKELQSEKGRFSTQQKELNEMKTFVKKLYSAAGVVLEGLGGGSVLPFSELDEGEEFPLIIEQFCENIQIKWLEWQGNHQLMHNELEKTLKTVEGLAEVVNESNFGQSSDIVDLEETEVNGHVEFPSPAPSGSVFIPSSMRSRRRTTRSPGRALQKESALALGLSRRNHLRKCRLLSISNSYDDNTAAWDHLMENSQFACEHCGDAFCRLAHVHSQLATIQNRTTATMTTTTTPPEKTAAVKKPRAKNGLRNNKRKINGVKRVTRNGTNKPIQPVAEDVEDPGSKNSKETNIITEMDCDDDDDEFGLNEVRSKAVVVDPDGQEHKFLGIKTSPLPPSKEKALPLNGKPNKRRYPCKCGKDYSSWPAFYHHMKSIDTDHYIRCEICQQDFSIHNALKAHMQNVHGKKYVQLRFPCLECDEKFSTKKQLEDHRELRHSEDANEENVEVGGNNNNDDDSDEEGALIIDEDYHSPASSNELE